MPNVKLPHPLNVKEQYMHAIITRLDEVIELLNKKEEQVEQEDKPAPRKARAKKEA